MGPEPGLWELDLRSEFPLLFVPHKESRAKITHSEAKEKCSGMYLLTYKALDLDNSMFVNSHVTFGYVLYRLLIL